MKTASLRLQNAIELIDNSEIFELSRESNPSKYRILEYELIENLYEYAQFLNSNRYQDMGLEIVETATDCLRSYDKNRGLFTHYFLTSLSRRVNKEQAIRNAIETRGGIVVPEKVQERRVKAHHFNHHVRKIHHYRINAGFLFTVLIHKFEHRNQRRQRGGNKDNPS